MKPISAQERQERTLREGGLKITNNAKPRGQALLTEAEEERLKTVDLLKVGLIQALMETHGLSEDEAIDKIEALGR